MIYQDVHYGLAALMPLCAKEIRSGCRRPGRRAKHVNNATTTQAVCRVESLISQQQQQQLAIPFLVIIVSNGKYNSGCGYKSSVSWFVSCCMHPDHL